MLMCVWGLLDFPLVTDMVHFDPWWASNGLGIAMTMLDTRPFVHIPLQRWCLHLLLRNLCLRLHWYLCWCCFHLFRCCCLFCSCFWCLCELGFTQRHGCYFRCYCRWLCFRCYVRCFRCSCRWLCNCCRCCCRWLWLAQRHAFVRQGCEHRCRWWRWWWCKSRRRHCRQQ